MLILSISHSVDELSVDSEYEVLMALSCTEGLQKVIFGLWTWSVFTDSCLCSKFWFSARKSSLVNAKDLQKNIHPLVLVDACGLETKEVCVPFHGFRIEVDHVGFLCVDCPVMGVGIVGSWQAFGLGMGVCAM